MSSCILPQTATNSYSPVTPVVFDSSLVQQSLYRGNQNFCLKFTSLTIHHATNTDVSSLFVLYHGELTWLANMNTQNARCSKINYSLE
jgi:hypothetical protein